MRGSNLIPVLMDKARTAHADCVAATTMAAGKALAAGAALAEAKALAAHGSWADWLAGAGISERTAQRYMKLHRGGLTSATVADLGIARAEAFASAGLRLWPEEGKAQLAVFSDGSGLDGCAVWWEVSPGRVFYRCLHIMPVPSMEAIVCAPKPIPPWLLGVFHDWPSAAFHHSRAVEITEGEAEARIIEASGQTIETHSGVPA